MVSATILGLGGALGVVTIIAVVLAVKYFSITSVTTPASTEPNKVFVFLSTWFGLFPYVFLLSGLIIDAINSTFMYSKASIVGAITVLATAIFGSDKFASISKSVLGFLPSIKTPGVTPDLPSTYNWLGILTYTLILGIVFVPMMVGQLAGWAWGTSVGLGALVILTILGGNDFLGSTVGEAFPPRRPVSGWSLNLGRTDVCTTPGLNDLQSRLAPAGILLTTSILTSHMFEAIDTKNNQTAIASGATALLSFAIECVIFYTSGCSTDYRYGKAAPFIALLLGTGAGATAYYTMRTVGQESFTSSDDSGGIFHPPPSQKVVKSDSEKLSTKIVVGPQSDTSAPVDDQDAFVCEAYKDGELITSTIVE